MQKILLDRTKRTDYYLDLARRNVHADGSLECPIEGCFNTSKDARLLGIHLSRSSHGIRSASYERNRELAMRKQNGDVTKRRKVKEEPQPMWDEDLLRKVIRTCAEYRGADWWARGAEIFQQVQEAIVPVEQRWAGKVPASVMNGVQTLIEELLLQKLVTMPIIVREVVKQDPMEILATVPKDILNQVWMQRVATPILEKLGTTFLDLVPRPEVGSKYVVPTFKEIENVRVRNKRVAIFGLQPDQAHSLRDQLSSCAVDLFFKEHATGNEQLPDADFCIVSKFTSHSTWDKARDKYSNERVVFTNGGITDITNMILKINQGLPINGQKK